MGDLSDARPGVELSYAARRGWSMIETVPSHDRDPTAKVLHAIVGHKLPISFLNAIRSVRMCAPADVGYALGGGHDLLHLIQGDMQMLWWGRCIVDRALDLYDSSPDCVNIVTTAIPRDRGVAGAVSEVQESAMELVGYGLTDTGLYHLGRWRERGVRFHGSEQGHARCYREAGLRVICHPWPPIAQLPWPAVVRNGEVKGREVVPEQPLLLRPLSDQEIADVKGGRGPTWLEDVCTPWGWTCLPPMLATALESIDYWVGRYRDLRSRGWRRARPTWERRGLEPERSIWRTQRRPSLWQVALLPPWHELRRRLR